MIFAEITLLTLHVSSGRETRVNPVWDAELKAVFEPRLPTAVREAACADERSSLLLEKIAQPAKPEISHGHCLRATTRAAEIGIILAEVRTGTKPNSLGGSR